MAPCLSLSQSWSFALYPVTFSMPPPAARSPLLHSPPSTTSGTAEHADKPAFSRGASFALVALAYVVAFGAGTAAGYGVQENGNDPVYAGAAGTAAAMTAIFLFSLCFGNTSFFDAFWSVAPIGLIVYWPLAAIARGREVPWERTLLVCLAVGIWAFRLTYNWIIGWTGLNHEDWRYLQMRKDITKGSNTFGARVLYWTAGSFLALHTIPTVEIYFALLPVYVALYRGTAAIGATDGIGLAVCLIATYLEWLADRQMRLWRQKNPNSTSTIDEGVWRYSRHPNYLGEALFWWGLYIFGIGADEPQRWWWTGVGALLITVMLLFASIPMMEKRQLERRPEAYAAYCRRVPSSFVFWFRRKTAK